MDTNQQLEQMKQKYQPVFRAIDQQQVHLTHVHIQDGKLFIQGAAMSESAKNKVWDEIKRVNPNWQNDLTCDIRVEAQQPPAMSSTGQTTVNTAQDFSTKHDDMHHSYTVRPGDTLSKISEQIYGNSHDYMRIFNANKDKLSDPNKIQVGQVLTIPQ